MHSSSYVLVFCMPCLFSNSAIRILSTANSPFCRWLWPLTKVPAAGSADFKVVFLSWSLKTVCPLESQHKLTIWINKDSLVSKLKICTFGTKTSVRNSVAPGPWLYSCLLLLVTLLACSCKPLQYSVGIPGCITVVLLCVGRDKQKFMLLKLAISTEASGL